MFESQCFKIKINLINNAAGWLTLLEAVMLANGQTMCSFLLCELGLGLVLGLGLRFKF